MDLIIIFQKLQTTNLLDKINTVEWYLLPNRHTRTYQMWVHHSQQLKIFYIAKIKPLNMQTSLSVSQINLFSILLVNLFSNIKYGFIILDVENHLYVCSPFIFICLNVFAINEDILRSSLVSSYILTAKKK